MSELLRTAWVDVQAPRAGFVATLTMTAVAASADLTGEPGGVGPAIATNTQQSGLGISARPSAAVSGSVTSTPAEPEKPGFLGHYVMVFADGADAGVIFGPLVANVTGANAPALATQGGAGTAGACFRIPAGQAIKYLLHGDDRFVGFVGSGNGTLRIAQASR